MIRSVITEILLYVLLILAQIGLGTLALLLKKRIEYYETQISFDKKHNLQHMVQILVKAAETIFKNGNGEAKREYVMRFLTQNLGLDEDTARAFLEEAVYQLKRYSEEWQNIVGEDSKSTTHHL